MSGKKALCSVLASVVVLAAMPACKPSPLEGYVVARVSGIAVPDYDVSQSELEAHPGSIPFNIHLIVDPTVNTDEMVGGDSSGDSSGWGPVVVSYGFGADGVCFKEEVLLGMEVPPPSPGAEIELADGGDGAWSAYECLTQITPGETDAAAGDRVWLRQFTLDIATSKSPIGQIGSRTEHFPQVDDEAFGPAAEIPLYVNEALLTWDLDPDADPDFFYVPLAMIAIIGFEPEGFKPYTEIAPPEGMIQVTPPSSDPEEVIENIKAMVMESDLGPHVVVEPESGPAGAINSPGGLFQFRLSPEANEGRDAAVSELYTTITSNYPQIAVGQPLDTRHILVAPVSGVAPSEPSVDKVHMYNGYAEGTVAVAADADLGVALTASSPWNGQTVEGLIVHNIPVLGESLFTPDEPHTIELPYTFWLDIAPVEFPPQESGPTDFVGEPHLLRVIVSPADGGIVTVSTPEGTQEQPDFPAEGDFQASLAFDYILDEADGEMEVTLSAEPAEGYRFVAWLSDDFHAEIQDASAPTTRLTIAPMVRGDMLPRQTTITAYFAAYIGEQPEDVFFDVMMGATIKPVSHTIEDESGCESIVSIDYEAVDLTGGQRPISYVQLDVNGEQLTSWSGTPTIRYHDDTVVESGCSDVLAITLSAINTEVKTMTATKEARIPPLSTHFEYDILDGPEGGDCKMQLVIDLQAVDLTVPDNPLTSVMVKGNGSTWYSSGSISTDSYEDSFGKLVGCGNTYLVEVIGTDSDGNTYTYRNTVEIPEGSSPPDDGSVPPSQTTLYAAVAASAQCTSSGPECSCQLSVSFDGKDLTGGTYPVTRVVLRVNGQVWHDSGSISTTDYHQTVHKTVNCGTTFSIQLTVDNAVGQTATSAGSLTTPTP